MSRAFLIGAALAALPAVTAHATTFTSAADFAAAAPAASLIEDFEGVAAGDRDRGLPALTRPAIGFTPLINDLVVASAGYTNFGADIGTTQSNVLTSNGNESLRGTLAVPAGALGFDVLLNGLGPATVSFYRDLTLLDTITFASGSGYAFAGIVDAGGVTRFEFTGTRGGELNTGIDNLRAGPVAAAVPEPSAWAMMLAGFVGIGAMLRRRRPAAAHA